MVTKKAVQDTRLPSHVDWSRCRERPKELPPGMAERIAELAGGREVLTLTLTHLAFTMSAIKFRVFCALFRNERGNLLWRRFQSEERKHPQQYAGDPMRAWRLFVGLQIWEAAWHGDIAPKGCKHTREEVARRWKEASIPRPISKTAEESGMRVKRRHMSLPILLQAYEGDRAALNVAQLTFCKKCDQKWCHNHSNPTRRHPPRPQPKYRLATA